LRILLATSIDQPLYTIPLGVNRILGMRTSLVLSIIVKKLFKNSVYTSEI